MSVSSLDTDADLCDLEVVSAMSTPYTRQTPLAPEPFEDDEFRPVLIELDAQGGISFPLTSTNILYASSGVEEDQNEPLLAIDSLLPMLQLVPGLLALDESVYVCAAR